MLVMNHTNDYKTSGLRVIAKSRKGYPEATEVGV
jgi:hypothetical protein